MSVIYFSEQALSDISEYYISAEWFNYLPECFAEMPETKLLINRLSFVSEDQLSNNPFVYDKLMLHVAEVDTQSVDITLRLHIYAQKIAKLFHVT